MSSRKEANTVIGNDTPSQFPNPNHTGIIQSGKDNAALAVWKGQDAAAHELVCALDRKLPIPPPDTAPSPLAVK